MGMLACYMETNNETIKRWKMESSEEIFEEIEELEEEGEVEVCELDKLWDGLHFLMTGASATAPPENCLLSEAVVGTTVFSDDESGLFISYVTEERVQEVAASMNGFDIEKALAGFLPHRFSENDIYPDIWDNEDADGLREELSEAFHDLKEFYAKMEQENKGVIVSIY